MRRSRRGRAGRIVREFLPQFRGEKKTRIFGDAVDPLRGHARGAGLVERCVDLDRVKKFGEVGCFVEAALAMRRINDARPIGVGPSSRADANFRGAFLFCAVTVVWELAFYLRHARLHPVGRVVMLELSHDRARRTEIESARPFGTTKSPLCPAGLLSDPLM